MQEREDDIGRTEYPTSAGLTFNHSFAHTSRLFCLKEPPLTSRRDKASIFLPYLCCSSTSEPSVAVPRHQSTTELLLGLLFGRLSLHQLRSFLHGERRLLVTSPVAPVWASVPLLPSAKTSRLSPLPLHLTCNA
jgi:hypothetical protein